MKHIKIPHIVSFLLILVTALITTQYIFSIQPEEIKPSFIIYILNFLPVLVFMIMLFFITGNTILSIGAVSFIAVLFSYVNRYKIIYRDDPFFHYDFAMAPELLGIIKSFGFFFIASIIGCILVFIFFVVLLFRFIRTKTIPTTVRIAGAFFSVILIIILNSTVYSDILLFESIPVKGSVYCDKDVFNSRGFIYSFIHTFNANKIIKPDGYNKSLIINSVQYETEPEPLPHIIFILGEGFTDFDGYEHINFEGYTDPYYNYKKLKQESVYGRIMIPGLGGGTSDTEFEIMTGLNARFFRGVPYVNRIISKEIETLPSLLKQKGYSAIAVHPGSSWFYNRQNAFRYMGFDRFYSQKDFNPKAENSGGYISDRECFNKLIELYESREPEKPLFCLTITIQNHGPYENKYEVGKNFNTDLKISPQSVNALSNYFEGIKQGDVQLKRLFDYFAKQDEPVVVVYFGDHMPSFNMGMYEELFGEYQYDNVQDRIEYYTTPYIIWCNDAAGSFAEAETLPAMSSFYLGAYLSELIGFEGLSPYFDFINELRNGYNAVWDMDYINPQGEVKNISEDETLKLFKYWNYYQVFE